MLPELIAFEDEATLVMRSGVQFMDFGLTLNLPREEPGQFRVRPTNVSVVRLEYDERQGNYLLPGPRTREQPDPGLETPVQDSVALLQDLWVPVPFLRRHGDTLVEGPTNWARARIAALPPGEDLGGHTHRLTLAFDTWVIEQVLSGAAYLAPTLEDVKSGSRFCLGWEGHHVAGLLETPWVNDWLVELFRDNAADRLKQDPDEVLGDKKGAFAPQAHYLNLLWLIGNRCRVPRIRILLNRREDLQRPIPVDLVLDVGNSRTCGILIEEPPQESDGLQTRYELELRDLSRPHLVYSDPFESRVELAEASFGKVDQSCRSGRSDAFLWPTIARIGPEATRLAARRRGTEGATGLSSPKRYLWDEERYESIWRFNAAFGKLEAEPQATAAPFGELIDEVGRALFTLPPEDQFPVFNPHYSRSSLMTFLLSEVVVHALVQINSVGQRMKMSHANVPRQLRRIILTVPPSMPKPEREIFQERMRQAIGLVWKALGWHPADAALEEEDRDLAWPPFPTFETRWDEATCAQVVYIFSEIVNHFAGRSEDFIATIRRPRPGETAERIRVASIDIGGGTTDLVVNDYSLDAGSGANRYVLPRQRFRDGFKLAGDDLVLEVVQKVVQPAIEAALREIGLMDPGPLLSKLMGAEADIVQNRVLRQQLALQVLYPLALRILHDYERYEPSRGADVAVQTVGEMLGRNDCPTKEVLEYFAGGVRRALGRADARFDLMAVRLPVDLNRLHELFLSDEMEICKTIRSLCEIVYLYDCDVLLLTGRPSRLPGVQALVRALLALPPDRVVPLHNYRAGVWYPFHQQGRIADPKTTAAVGAMLCVLGQGRIPNFWFRANDFRSYSTVRYIGMMDRQSTIKDVEVFYRDVDLDSPDYALPDTPFEMRGQMVLGYRQLAAERWNASPLYLMEQTDRGREVLYGAKASEAAALLVTLRRDRQRKGESLVVARVSTAAGSTVTGEPVRARLYTLNTGDLGESSYWLDTGSVVR